MVRASMLHRGYIQLGDYRGRAPGAIHTILVNHRIRIFPVSACTRPGRARQSVWAHPDGVSVVHTVIYPGERGGGALDTTHTWYDAKKQWCEFPGGRSQTLRNNGFAVQNAGGNDHCYYRRKGSTRVNFVIGQFFIYSSPACLSQRWD